jgi:hypothetical protein
MAGKSLIRAMAAPARMATDRPVGNRYASNPGAEMSLATASSATNDHGTAWYTAAVNRK